MEGTVIQKMETEKIFGTVGAIGRFKPLHLGGASMLESLCEKSEHLIIGIGSSNMYNLRSPFTAEESQEMIDRTLSSQFDNYSFIHVPDFGHIPEYRDGQMWRSYVKQNYGELDAFISGNVWVRDLMKEDYDCIVPVSLVQVEKRVRVKGSMVRMEIAKGSELWKKMVPAPVAEYLQEDGLMDRFKKEFGLATLAYALEHDYARPETAEEEKNNVTK